MLSLAPPEHIVQQVPRKALEHGVVGQLAVPVEHDPRRVGIAADALPDPQVGRLGEVATDARRQDGIAGQLLDRGVGGQVVLVGVAKEVVREGVPGPGLDRVGAGTGHRDDVDPCLVVAHAADLAVDVGEPRLGVPVGHARPVRRLMLADADRSQLAPDRARAGGGLGRAVGVRAGWLLALCERRRGWERVRLHALRRVPQLVLEPRVVERVCHICRHRRGCGRRRVGLALRDEGSTVHSQMLSALPVNRGLVGKTSTSRPSTTLVARRKKNDRKI